jgi:hypothetical protein
MSSSLYLSREDLETVCHCLKSNRQTIIIHTATTSSSVEVASNEALLKNAWWRKTDGKSRRLQAVAHEKNDASRRRML